MVINEQHKFIFVHVYRTAGSSIDQAFDGHINNIPTHTKLEDIPNWEDYFSFGFIRNPWDRMVSSHMYNLRTGKTTGTFENWIENLVPRAKEYAQYTMVENCSFIGRFEHLQEDLETAFELIGAPTPNLKHIWKTNHKPYQEYYNDNLIQKVYDHQSGDIDHFGFTFDSTATKDIGDRR